MMDIKNINYKYTNELDSKEESNSAKEVKQLQTYYDIQKILNEIKKLEIEFEKLIINNENKENRYKIAERLFELKKQLDKGIKFNYNFDIFKDNIILFLKKLGCLNDTILEKLNNAEFIITEVKFLTNAEMYTFSNKIYIDSSYIEFDNNGYPIGIKKEKAEKFNHIITHELFHLISYIEHKPVTGNALSEGYTDLFALMISKRTDTINKHYSFFIKIAYLFTEMLGLQNSIDDYLNNLGDYNNLANLFNSIGIEKNYIKELNKKLNYTLSLIKNNDENADSYKEQIINELKVIINKYMSVYPEKIDIEDLFNILFGSKKQKKMVN